jgi:hypothetical protein
LFIQLTRQTKRIYRLLLTNDLPDFPEIFADFFSATWPLPDLATWKPSLQKKKLNLAAAEVAGNGEPVQKEEEVPGQDDLTIASRQRLGARFLPDKQNFVWTM